MAIHPSTTEYFEFFFISNQINPDASLIHNFTSDEKSFDCRESKSSLLYLNVKMHLIVFSSFIAMCSMGLIYYFEIYNDIAFIIHIFSAITFIISRILSTFLIHRLILWPFSLSSLLSLALNEFTWWFRLFMLRCGRKPIQIDCNLKYVRAWARQLIVCAKFYIPEPSLKQAVFHSNRCMIVARDWCLCVVCRYIFLSL